MWLDVRLCFDCFASACIAVPSRGIWVNWVMNTHTYHLVNLQCHYQANRIFFFCCFSIPLLWFYNFDVLSRLTEQKTVFSPLNHLPSTVISLNRSSQWKNPFYRSGIVVNVYNSDCTQPYFLQRINVCVTD